MRAVGRATGHKSCVHSLLFVVLYSNASFMASGVLFNYPVPAQAMRILPLREWVGERGSSAVHHIGWRPGWGPGGE